MTKGTSVLQLWVEGLTFMQQSVLLTALRGPDGIHKNHVSKLLIRWLRRCILLSAFDAAVINNPWAPGGGSFTGPSILKYTPEENDRTGNFHVVIDGGPDWQSITWQGAMFFIVDEYLQRTDEMPHHFQMHFMHAAEILGYKHPQDEVRAWWHLVYCKLVNDMHVNPESEETMDVRLGDNESSWREAEEVVAKGPTDSSFVEETGRNGLLKA